MQVFYDRYVTQSELVSYPATQCTYNDGRQVDSFYDVLYRRNAVTSNGPTGATSELVADWQFFGPSRVGDMKLGNGMLCSMMNNAQTNSAVQSGVPNGLRRKSRATRRRGMRPGSRRRGEAVLTQIRASRDNEEPGTF